MKTIKHRRKRKRILRIIIVLLLRILFFFIFVLIISLIICGFLYIHDYFKYKSAPTQKYYYSSIDNFSKISDLDNTSNICIILDAGHGGTDGGTTEYKTNEKDINLSVTKYLKEIFEDCGIDVVLTRETDKLLSLSQRTDIANKNNADLFISIHCNYFEDDSSVSGLECYYYYNQTESQKIAENIISSADNVNGITVRSAKSEDYYVLRHTKMPAVLVELGYLSNSMERKSLTDKDYQKLLAKAIADGILEVFED